MNRKYLVEYCKRSLFFVCRWRALFIVAIIALLAGCRTQSLAIISSKIKETQENYIFLNEENYVNGSGKDIHFLESKLYMWPYRPEDKISDKDLENILSRSDLMLKCNVDIVYKRQNESYLIFHSKQVLFQNLATSQKAITNETSFVLLCGGIFEATGMSVKELKSTDLIICLSFTNGEAILLTPILIANDMIEERIEKSVLP